MLHFPTVLLIAIMMLLHPHPAVSRVEQGSQTLSVNDFAHGLILESSREAPIYQMDLPLKVYQGVLRPDLRDIAIFNAAGSEIPHLLRISQGNISPGRNSTPEGSGTIEPSPSPLPVSLPFFPLYKSPLTALGNTTAWKRGESADGVPVFNDLSMEIIQNSHGTIIQVKSRKKGKEGDNALLSGYLLDMTHLEAPMISLELQWVDRKKNFITTVHVKASNDLNQWTLLTRSTLARLKFSGHAIDQFRIPLHPSKTDNNTPPKQYEQYKYLHLSWPAGDQGVELSQVTAITNPAIPEKDREWLDLPAGRFHSTNAMVIEYDTGGFLPVDAIQLKFREKNSIIRATLQSRSGGNSPWRRRCHGVFYTLQVDGRDLFNDIFTFFRTQDRFWRINVERDGAGLEHAHARGEVPPLLQIAWHPHELLFLARGEPPYTLAWGSGKLKASSRKIPSSDMILQALARHSGSKNNNNKTGSMVARVVPGSAVVLGGAKALQIPMPPLPWKKWLLWGFLVAGVVLLALMTWKLARQMNFTD